MNIHNRTLLTRSIHTCHTLLREAQKNMKAKTHSSQLWISRQLRDRYVEQARQQHYRCRSAFKLLEINERFNFLRPGLTVVDCGAAPGSWTQVAVKQTNSDGRNTAPVGNVIAIDKLPIHPIAGAIVLGNMDFTENETQVKLKQILKDMQVDVVLSDMAPNATGIKDMDHDNIITLAYTALKFALCYTKVNGVFICKLWQGGKSMQFQKELFKFYNHVKIIRPEATRTESSEIFILASGFKGLKTETV